MKKAIVILLLIAVGTALLLDHFIHKKNNKEVLEEKEEKEELEYVTYVCDLDDGYRMYFDYPGDLIHQENVNVAGIHSTSFYNGDHEFVDAAHFPKRVEETWTYTAEDFIAQYGQYNDKKSFYDALPYEDEGITGYAFWIHNELGSDDGVSGYMSGYALIYDGEFFRIDAFSSLDWPGEIKNVRIEKY